MNRNQPISSGPHGRPAALIVALFILQFAAFSSRADLAGASGAFQRGSEEYAATNFESAAALFREAASVPSAGALYNLGDAEWRSDQPGPAILAWEQAQWLNPFNRNIVSNLRYARRVRQLDAPELAWYEICSTWLPANWWPWLSCSAFWLAAAMIMLPGILGWRRAGWQQGLAAASFAVFLLTIPTLAGVHTRSKLGIVLPADAPLRLTPTADAQELTRLPAGQAVRFERTRGDYAFVRAGNAAGWLQRGQLGMISQ